MLTTMGSSEQLSRISERRNSQYFKLPISTVRNIIRKWKINGTAEVKGRCGRPRKISDRKKVAVTGLAVHRTTIHHTLNDEDLHSEVARKNDLNTKLSV